jgi:hypothetical protein
MPRTILDVLVLAVGLATPMGVQAACPPDSLVLGGFGLATYNSARFDTTSSYGGSFHAAWDLISGSVAMSQCCAPALTWVQSSDDFDVVGVPPGTPVSLTVLFTVDSDVYNLGCGDPNCGGLVGMALKHLPDQTAQQHVMDASTSRQNYHDVLQEPLTIVAGQPERIDFLLYGRETPGGNDGADATGAVSFSGVPNGAAVVSCQGYGVGVTPAHSVSWGRLKSHYR